MLYVCRTGFDISFFSFFQAFYQADIGHYMVRGQGEPYKKTCIFSGHVHLGLQPPPGLNGHRSTFVCRGTEIPLNSKYFQMNLYFHYAIHKQFRRGAVQKKLTILADKSVFGGGGQNPCPLRKCKFLLGGEKLLGIFRNFCSYKIDVLYISENSKQCSPSKQKLKFSQRTRVSQPPPPPPLTEISGKK